MVRRPFSAQLLHAIVALSIACGVQDHTGQKNARVTGDGPVAAGTAGRAIPPVLPSTPGMPHLPATVEIHLSVASGPVTVQPGQTVTMNFQWSIGLGVAFPYAIVGAPPGPPLPRVHLEPPLWTCTLGNFGVSFVLSLHCYSDEMPGDEPRPALVTIEVTDGRLSGPLRFFLDVR